MVIFQFANCKHLPEGIHAMDWIYPLQPGMDLKNVTYPDMCFLLSTYKYYSYNIIVL